MFKFDASVFTHIAALCTLFTLLDNVQADETSGLLTRAEAVAREAFLRQYASDMALAQMAWQMGKLDRASALLERHIPKKSKSKTENGAEENAVDETAASDHRGMEWHLLWRMMHAEKMVLANESNPPSALAFSPDDSEVISGERSYTYTTPAAVKAWATDFSDAALAGEQAAAASKTIWTQEANQEQANAYFFGMHSMALSADGKRIAVPDNHMVRVVDRSTNKIEWTMSGHTDFTAAVAISTDGKLLASGGLDRKLNIWSLETGELVESLPGHEFGILAIAFSPDGKTLVVGGGDDRAPDWHRRQNGELKIWTIQSDDEPRTIKVTANVTSLEYSADKHFIAAGLFDGKTLLLDASKESIQRTIEQSTSVTCIRFSPDAKVLATATADGLVKLWEVGNGLELATYRGHRGRVDCLAFSHNGLWVASGGMDRTIRIWDANVFPERTRIALPAWSIHTADFSEDSKTLMVSDFNQVWLIDPSSNRVRTSWHTNHWTIATAISSDGTRLATAGQRNTRGGGGALVWLWNAADSSKPTDLVIPMHSATSVAFSKDGRALVARCQSDDHAKSSVRLYAVDSGELLHAWEAAYHFALSSDGRCIAVALAEDIALYSFQERKEVGRFAGEAARAHTLQFSPDGTHLATASFDHSLCIWNTASQSLIKTLNGHQQVIEQIRFSPDGHSLVTADSNQTILWDLSSATVRFALPQGSCPMTFTRDNRTLITASGEVHFWQVATGDELISFPHYGYESRTLALSPDGNFLAQAGGNRDESNGVWVWNAAGPK